MKTEEVGKAFACVKSVIVTRERAVPTAVSDVRPLPCLLSCPMGQVVMVWGSR